jgi:hypothetical protein
MKARLYKLFAFSVVGSFGVLAGAALAVAATTIGTDINTGGNLSVTGTTTLSGDVVFSESADKAHTFYSGTPFSSFSSLFRSNSFEKDTNQVIAYHGPMANTGILMDIIDEQTSDDTSMTNPVGLSVEVASQAGDGDTNDYSPYVISSSAYNTGSLVMGGAFPYSGNCINLGSGSIGSCDVFWARRPFGSVTNAVSFFSDALGGTASNAYVLWGDDQGVFRIKADNTFNTVYQDIAALYNPQFTKYTPGATNYERVVLGEWNSNVAEIGTENSGTGSARALALITAGTARMTIGPTGNVGIATTSPVANFQVANGNNATTTMELGSSGQNKGSCLKLYRTDGSAIYAYVAAGATTFTLTTTACASISNF